MTDQITLSYTNGSKDTADAMIHSGVALGKAYRDWPFFILSLLVFALCLCGGMFVGLSLWIFVFDQRQSALWLLPATAVPALLIYQQMFKRMVHTQAKTTIRTRFGSQPQSLVFNSEGVTQTNAVATWQTAWAGVENIVKTPRGLGVTISGIVVPISDEAFDSKAHKKDVLAQLNKWHQAAL